MERHYASPPNRATTPDPCSCLAGLVTGASRGRLAVDRTVVVLCVGLCLPCLRLAARRPLTDGQQIQLLVSMSQARLGGVASSGTTRSWLEKYGEPGGGISDKTVQS